MRDTNRTSRDKQDRNKDSDEKSAHNYCFWKSAFNACSAVESATFSGERPLITFPIIAENTESVSGGAGDSQPFV